MWGSKRHARRGRSGFTLIELMLCVTVLVVAISTAVASQLVAFNLLKTSRETDIAMGDLQGAMEELVLRNIDTLPIAGSPYAAGQPIVAFDDLHLRNESIVATYPNYVAGSQVPDPLQIVVTMTWNDYLGRPRTLRLASMRTK
jgi:prepilin-type N-terminal cleavage/methylation domain-containing protein